MGFHAGTAIHDFTDHVQLAAVAAGYNIVLYLLCHLTQSAFLTYF